MVNSILDFNWLNLNNGFVSNFIEQYIMLNSTFESLLLDYFETIKFIELNYVENVHQLIIDYQFQSHNNVTTLIDQFSELRTNFSQFKLIWIELVKNHFEELNLYNMNKFNVMYTMNLNGGNQLSILECTNLQNDRSKRRKIDLNYFKIFKSIPLEEILSDVTSNINSIAYNDEISINYKINKLKSIISPSIKHPLLNNNN